MMNRTALRLINRRLPRPRFLATAPDVSGSKATSPENSQPERPRINQVGIQYLSTDLHSKLFPSTNPTDYQTLAHPELLPIAKQHLQHNDLWGKKTTISDPITINHFPELQGKTLDEHFYKIGMGASQPYLSMAESLFASSSTLPPIPKSWRFQQGWTRYVDGKDPEPVPFPLEQELVFDVEVMYNKSDYAVIATCASKDAWYGWVSPFLIEYSKDPSHSDMEHLISFDCLKNPKLMVGHNVSYDRSRVLEEYNIKQSSAFYLDSMALHVAVAGICSQQRPKWHKHKKSKSMMEAEEELADAEQVLASSPYDSEIARDVASELVDDPWLNKGSPNSLASVLDFHCGIKLDKTNRDYFALEDPQEIISNFNLLMDYCAKDVEGTFLVTKKLFPEFRKKVPHPVSFGALRHMGTLFLPTTKKWDTYVEAAEDVYQENREQVSQNLRERALELVEYIEKNDPTLKPEFESDPWLRQLDWNLKLPRLKKDGTPVANNAFLTGYPEWYRELFKTTTTGGEKKRELNLTVRTRITPLLLRLKWEGYPLIWTDSSGWCFKVPYKEEIIQQMESKNYTRARLNEEDMEKFLPELRDDGMAYEMFKIPHPDGPSKRTTSVLSKGYFKYFENGTLTSEYNYAQGILTLNNAASYWMGNRSRISSQMVVYSDVSQKKNKFFEKKKDGKEHPDMGIIIPKLCTMGTITRRATENTWLTASNAKKNRIGSELKSLVEAPKGYVFVGADVDSEELWIASLVGDSMFGIHGGTALGWMTLEGDKTEGTDLHSKTAEIMGISRNDAKVFNYGRIYGAGVRFATRLLKQCNASLSDTEAEAIAVELYAKTKGQISKSRFLDRRLYHGGSESVMFNALEAIAYQQDPRTPVLGAAITDALTISNLNKNEYLTSRINWAIQSSGVDYLHLLIVSMTYLIERFRIDARLAITVHDELRFLVKEEDKYKAALLLQISNAWTRAMFSEQLGIKELPQSCAFFSEVDIDHVLRKEVNMDCVTPSQPNAITPGESLSISKLLEITEHGNILDDSKKKVLPKTKYETREPVISTLDKDLTAATKVAKARLQSSVDKEEWRQNIGLYIQSKKSEIDSFTSYEEKPKYSKAKKTTKAKVTTSKPRSSSPKVAYSSRIREEFDIGGDGTALLEQELKKQAPATTPATWKKPYESTSSTTFTSRKRVGLDPGIAQTAGKLEVKAAKTSSVTGIVPKKVQTTARSGNSRLIRRVSKPTKKLGIGDIKAAEPIPLDKAGQPRPSKDSSAEYHQVLRREDSPSYVNPPPKRRLPVP